MSRSEYSGDAVDAGAAELRGYTAAEAAHMFQEFLERRISLEGFSEWLRRYPHMPDRNAEAREVEEEINRATLALRAYRQGTRSWEQVRNELRDARGRLSGHAFQAGEEAITGDRSDPAGHPIDRSFP